MKNLRQFKKLAIFAAVAALPTGSVCLGAAFPIDPKLAVTATMDGGIAETGNTWYEVGVNPDAPATGLRTGLINRESDPLSTYLFESAVGNNALMLDSTTASGAISFTRPLSFTGLSLSGASGNGTGTVVPTLRFDDNTTSTLAPMTLGDWFNNTPRVQTAQGRIDVGANTFNNVGLANPRVLAADQTLSEADAAKFITGIDFTWTGSGANTHTALFGVSADFTGLGIFTAIPLTGDSFNRDIIVGLQEIPEPGTFMLIGVGALGLLACYRRHRR